MEIVLPLMQAASMLQYARLFEACSSFLQEQLSPDNCLSMIRLSEILHCSSLKEKVSRIYLVLSMYNWFTWQPRGPGIIGSLG
uniref:Uncharacterized protein n=1 Tax=Hucho hucho TaxID=62062 RepID=A0A4W5LPZ7_9TELE